MAKRFPTEFAARGLIIRFDSVNTEPTIALWLVACNIRLGLVSLMVGSRVVGLLPLPPKFVMLPLHNTPKLCLRGRAVMIGKSSAGFGKFPCKARPTALVSFPSVPGWLRSLLRSRKGSVRERGPLLWVLPRRPRRPPLRA